MLDSGTDTVSVVDADSGKRIADLDAPSGVEEVILLGDKTVVVTGANGFNLIDSTSNVVAGKLDLKGDLHDIVIMPDSTTALALSKGDLSVIDGRTTTVTTHIAGLTDPIAVAFAK